MGLTKVVLHRDQDTLGAAKLIDKSCYPTGQPSRSQAAAWSMEDHRPTWTIPKEELIPGFLTLMDLCCFPKVGGSKSGMESTNTYNKEKS